MIIPHSVYTPIGKPYAAGDAMVGITHVYSPNNLLTLFKTLSFSGL